MREPLFKMSYTGLKFEDVSLHVLDFALVVAVDLPRDKTQIAWFITLVDVDAIQFKMRLIPAFKRNNVAKKRGFVSAPGRI